MNKKIEEALNLIIHELEQLDIAQKVEEINQVRKKISSVSPFKDEPVDCVLWVKSEDVQANEYNPNKVASPEMKLLHTSIKEDGYTQPIVAFQLPGDKLEVVDGFHRNRVGKEYKDISKRIHGYLPVTTIDKPLDERMGSTIRHNRARGSHQIRSMAEIVIELTGAGWSEQRICEEIGMELDEVIRLKQITGLKEAFQDYDFSKSWEEFETRHYKKNEQ